jgi:2-polyprenyl-6-methoxyphenol hydroxylase-like FAD-dependent oxidoreductase
MALRTVVVGGGIAGLSLARELTRRGLEVAVLERTPKVAAVGAGIIMNPNAMAVLERNGLAAGVRAQSCPYLARDTHDHRGRWLATRDYRPLYAAGRLVEGALVHRGHLQQCLHDGLPAGVVHYGAQVRALEAGPDGVRIEVEGGEPVPGDVLVGADGLRSQVRDRFFGPNEPAYLGYRSHRFVVPNRDGVAHFTEFLGRGQSIGLVPIGGGQLYVWTTFESARVSRAWGLESVDAFRRFFARFTDARVRRALDRVESVENVICTDIEEVHQDPWVAGRVVLLGDAAHAITPGLGQGAGMAMEGAAVLAEELVLADRGGKDLTAALASYAARRRDRVAMVARLSRAVIERGQLANPLACWLRNRRIWREGRAVAQTQATLERLLTWPPREPTAGREA